MFERTWNATKDVLDILGYLTIITMFLLFLAFLFFSWVFNFYLSSIEVSQAWNGSGSVAWAAFHFLLVIFTAVFPPVGMVHTWLVLIF